jgi:hypothetical protein
MCGHGHYLRPAVGCLWVMLVTPTTPSTCSDRTQLRTRRDAINVDVMSVPIELIAPAMTVAH